MKSTGKWGVTHCLFDYFKDINEITVFRPLTRFYHYYILQMLILILRNAGRL